MALTHAWVLGFFVTVACGAVYQLAPVALGTTLDLDADVMLAARELAAAERRTLGAVVSELARRGLTPASAAVDGELPVIRVPAGTGPITPEMVRRALDDD